MKAWVLHNIDDLRLSEVKLPVLSRGEVLVRVKCAGICSSDVQRVFVSGAYHYPIILGHEFSGIVEKAYSDAEASWIGKRVGVYPLLPKFANEGYRTDGYETSSDYGYLGSRQDGGFAEYVAVPVWNLIEIPEKIGFEEAAMLEPTSVAFHAVRQIDFTHVRNVAVIGNGTIGHLIAQWLSIYGVPKITLVGRQDVLPEEVDVCFEVVGSVEGLERCITATKPNGQIVVVGNPPADFHLEQKIYWQILRKQLVVRGTWNSRFPDDWRKVLDAVGGGRLFLSDFITHRFGFFDLAAAFEMVKRKEEQHLKILIHI
ncbi:galactitol-1-phosphate 5-dehydrogenase [Desulfitobacterium hafniense]|uniref:galactitol-1-phosphate 5-dehydrogenase n=1 Tax=Desulfitobacterium hafniense TaxID=49338 RepID=UPI000302C16E|nr:galactitol-1-phosphate 5-dehydrogenase [Desulfitobacterium hafniense]